MGPLVSHDADRKEVMRAVRSLLGLAGAHHMEVNHPWLDRNEMTGLGFKVHEGVTHLIELPENEEEAWAALRGTARNRVRKAMKKGVTAQITDDPAVIEHFFSQFEEVYGKQGQRTPFGIERPRSLWKRLVPAGKLLSLWVHVGGEVAAAGLFPFDERCIYFWGAASWIRYQAACPNELLQWTVIKAAVERGIPFYNMCGGKSQFKDKFGGEDVPNLVYYRSALPGLSTARALYRKLHFRSLLK